MLQVKIKKKLGNFLLDVDFSMDGGIFAILGASGCGKSMTQTDIRKSDII